MNRPARPATGTIDWQEVHRRLELATAATEGIVRLSAERAQAVMAERARLLACVPPQAPQAAEVLEVLTFSLGSERYAVEARFVRKVDRYRDCAPVPGAPDFLAGVMNLRGDILPVFDLRSFFRVPHQEISDLGRVIVLGTDHPELAVLADAAHEVTTVRVSEVLEPPGSLTGAGREFLRGVTQDALIVLDGGVLLRDDRLVIDQEEDAGS